MNKTIKLIATDMDGTLLNSKKEMPDELFEWIKNHSDIRFVIASGRQYYTLKKDFLPVHEEIVYIAENGALVFYKDKQLYVDAMEPSDVKLCLDKINEIDGVKVILCGVESAYMTTPDAEEKYNAGMYYERLTIVDDLYEQINKDSFLKLAVYFRNEAAEENFSVFNDLPKHLKPVLSGVSWIDISNASVNKGTAMDVIKDKFSADSSECMAFGDYLNDMELLLSVQESYCMENGHDDMKKMAKYIAPSNDNNGVMKVLMERFK